MCKWIVEEAAAHDSRPVPPPPLLPLAHGLAAEKGPVGPPQGDGSACVNGFAELVQIARLPTDLGHNLLQDILAMGAVDVRELSPADWGKCGAFARARPLEQRRLLNAVSGA